VDENGLDRAIRGRGRARPAGRGDVEKNGVMDAVVRDLQILFDMGVMGALSDGQLLDRFMVRREEARWRCFW
jgi:hypothetical protein